MKMRTLIGLASASLLAACATTAAIPVFPALTVYDRSDCSDLPDLAGAIDLTPQKDKKSWIVDQTIDGDTPCVVQDGNGVPYMIFALPEAGSSRAVEVGSVLERGRLFSPRVAILDGDGGMVRRFDADKMMFRTSIYSVRFVPGDDERYALVTAEPTMIGKAYDLIRSGVVATTVYTGYGASTWYSGTEAQTTHAFSYDGLARGIVYRLED